MVTLANVQGSSLVADNSAFIERLEKAGIKASNIASKEREDLAFEESLAKAGGNTPLAKELARIERIRPGGAKLGLGILASTDAIEVANAKRENESAAKFATFLKPLNPAQRATQIRKEAERIRSETPGKDVSSLAELANMPTEKQDIEISKQQTFASDFGKLTDFRIKQLELQAQPDKPPSVQQQEAFNAQISNVLQLAQEQPTAQAGQAVIQRVLDNPSVPVPVKAGLRAVLPQQQGIVETDINEQGTIPPSQLTQNIEATQRRLAPAAKEQETFQPVFDAQGNVVGQQSSLTNRVVTDPRAGKATGPKIISPSQLTDDGNLIEQLPDGSIRQTNVVGVKNISDDKKATGETNIFSNGAVINALKNGTSSVIAPDGREVFGDERIKILKEAGQFELDLARTTAGEKKAGALSIDRSVKAFDQLSAIKTSVLNIDNAIKALDEGAESGPIISKLPAVRASSVRLNQVQGQMGLDVIGTTTFGALSESELNFALSTALPRNLRPPALRKWLVEKKQVQNKLANYLQDVAVFLGTPGNTVKGWVQAQQALQSQLGIQGGDQIPDQVPPETGRFTIREKP